MTKKLLDKGNKSMIEIINVNYNFNNHKILKIILAFYNF